jgi:hypothetical protein
MGGLILGALFGAVVGYAYSESQSVKRLAKKAKKAVEGVRLPKPDFMMHLPDSETDYATLGTVICECATLHPDPDPEILRNCVLSELYPDFPWPPIPGDHPTVAQLWTIVDYQVTRSAAEGTLCK